jgi:hypothetical protein
MIWVFCKGLNAEYPVQQTFNRPVLPREGQFWTSPMPAAITAIMFGILGLIAIWAIRNNIRSGTATSRGWTLHD